MKPLYSKIASFLKEKISNNEYLPGQQIPTEIELAQQFNVSQITSKRALDELVKEGVIYRKRGSGSFVKPQKVDVVKTENILGPINTLNKVVYMLVPFHGSDEWLMDYIQGATETLSTKGYYLNILVTNRDQDQERELFKTFLNNTTSGIIYYPTFNNVNIDLLYALCLENCSIVTIDKYFGDLPMSYVVSDNIGGGRMAVSFLVELGHHRIAFVSDNKLEATSSVRDRYFGYCQGLKDNGLPIDSETIFIRNDSHINCSEKDRYQYILTELLEQKVTSVLVNNDLNAVKVMEFALDMGIKIPEDLSIVGFDNIDSSQHSKVPLTTVAQDFTEIGKKAAEMLLTKMEEGNRQIEKVVLPVKMVERDSTVSVKQKVDLGPI